MNPVQIHLALNHFPIVGVLIAVVLVGLGLTRRHAPLSGAGLGLLVVSALVSLPVYWSGEPTEERLEDIVSISHQVVHDHEEAAEAAWAMTLAAGAFSIATLIARRRFPNHARQVQMVTLVVSALASVALLRTGHLGGLIRHGEELGQERRAPGILAPENAPAPGDDDKD